MATILADSTRHDPFADRADSWQAVLSRDARFDGRFVYAVRSTRVYCRPSCPSRRPARENVRFFSEPALAEAAGYRACRRCDPRSAAPGGAGGRAIERAKAYLDAHSDRRVPLAELAAHVGLSASHLQRSFAHATGLSPRQYHDVLRMRTFTARLRAGDTVSRATYEAGFGSSSRVYERADTLLGMTPASYRRGGLGVRIEYTIADVVGGRVLVATTDRGVCAVELGASDAGVERALRARFPNATIERRDDAHQPWVRAVLDRVRDPRHVRGANPPLDVAGTDFQQLVWNALREIPSGERRTYREVAAAIGRPTATRAVASACAANPVAILIPCHRVVRNDGRLAGYRWGVERKQRLLDSEQSGEETA